MWISVNKIKLIIQYLQKCDDKQDFNSFKTKSQMKKIFILFIFLTTTNIYSQNNGLKNYHQTLKYTSVYKVDLDINTWELQNHQNTSVIFDLDENGKGRIIVYYISKHVFFVERNYRVNYSDGSGTYFFVLDNGGNLRLGITPDNYTSAFSLVFRDNTTITFSNK